MNLQLLIRKLDEVENTSKNNILTETITYKLWENAGQKILEAQLTPDQINQLFQQVEQGATASGSNRTLIGKGKDVAGAVNKAWEDLKTKVQSSGPIKNVDAAYDQAAEKLKQATGGDQGVMKYVQMYRDFAKKHPIAQGLIYSALIAAAGISGAGLGGAAALGLFKMVDKLLQGEKFSSAAYQGAKTGAMAYGASKVGDYIKGKMGNAPGQNELVGKSPEELDAMMSTGKLTGKMSYDQAYNTYIQKFAQDPNNPSATIIQQAKQFAATKAKQGVQESTELTDQQINLIFEHVSDSIILEGIWDSLKGAAGKAVNWAQTKGANLTNKVTADKLQQAWKAAGSPTDSEEVKKILQSAGVDAGIIDQAFTTIGVRSSSTAQPTTPSASTAQGQPTIKVSEINKTIPTLKLKDLKVLQKLVDNTLAKRSTQPTTP